MRCPKCGYVSFEYLDTCKKCSKDLFEFKEKAGIFLMEPGYLDLSKYEDGLKPESAPSSVAVDDMEYSAEAGVLDEASDEPTTTQETDFFESLDMDEEQEEAGVAEKEAVGAGIDDDLDLNPEESGAEDLSRSFSEAEEPDFTKDDGIDLIEAPEIEIGESENGESSQISIESEGADLTEDDDLLGLDLVGENISLDLEDEGETNVSEVHDLKIDMSAGNELAGDSMESEELGSTEAGGGIEFSLDLDEGGVSSLLQEEDSVENFSEEADDDINGEIDLMLEDLEDEPEKP